MLYFLLGRVFSLFLLYTVADRMSCLVLFLGVFAVLLPPVPAPVPRCSPMIIINKVVEWNSLTSDRQNICAHLTPLTRFYHIFRCFLNNIFWHCGIESIIAWCGSRPVLKCGSGKNDADPTGSGTLIVTKHVAGCSNPFFPVPPCEYGGPMQAVLGKYRFSMFPVFNAVFRIRTLKTRIPICPFSPKVQTKMIQIFELCLIFFALILFFFNRLIGTKWCSLIRFWRNLTQKRYGSFESAKYRYDSNIFLVVRVLTVFGVFFMVPDSILIFCWSGSGLV